YYNSNTGRFTQVDPIFNPSISPYSYANNNPLKYVDPSGNEPLKVYGIQLDYDPRSVSNNPAKWATQASQSTLTQIDNPSDADIAMIAGHHFTRDLYIWGTYPKYSAMAYNELPYSMTTKVCTFSSCHTVMSPKDFPNAINIIEGDESLRKSYPFVQAVLGYESRAGLFDEKLSQEFGSKAKEFIDNGDYEGLARFWVETGQNLYNQGKSYSFQQERASDRRTHKPSYQRAFSAYYSKDGAWYFISSTQTTPLKVGSYPVFTQSTSIFGYDIDSNNNLFTSAQPDAPQNP
ncbi:hypothetical protein J4471_05405, partial [Candidatus Woesearchaeota archaeon]|nr:hypothetical protein [Candidatus Woesearchaeota archaeon]